MKALIVIRFHIPVSLKNNPFNHGNWEKIMEDKLLFPKLFRGNVFYYRERELFLDFVRFHFVNYTLYLTVASHKTRMR